MSTSPQITPIVTVHLLGGRLSEAAALILQQLQPLTSPRLLRAGEQASQAQPIDPKNGRSFKLKQLYKALDCQTVDVVWVQESVLPGYILICDDEALFVDKPVQNLVATILAGQPITGDVILCRTEQFQ